MGGEEIDATTRNPPQRCPDGDSTMPPHCSAKMPPAYFQPMPPACFWHDATTLDLTDATAPSFPNATALFGTNRYRTKPRMMSRRLPESTLLVRKSIVVGWPSLVRGSSMVMGENTELVRAGDGEVWTKDGGGQCILQPLAEHLLMGA